MKKVLYIIKFLAFVVAFSLVFQIFLTSVIDYNPAKNSYRFSLGADNADEDYFDSEIFVKMTGTSFSDVLKYSELEMNLEEVPKSKRGLSANELNLTDNYDKDIEAFSKLYDSGNSNISFLINTILDGKEKSFANINNKKTAFDDYRNDDYKYIYYNAKEDEFDSNINIEKTTVKSLLNNYTESFGDEYELIFGIEKALPVKDAFYDSSIIFKDFSSNFYLKIVIIFISVFIYLALTIYLSIYVFAKARRAGSKVSLTDTIPFEIRVPLLGICVVPYIFILDNYDKVIEYLSSLNKHNSILLFVYIVCAFGILEFLINFFYYGFLRRVANRQLFKTSFIVRFLKKIICIAEDMLRNINITIKNVVIFFVLLVLNIFAGLIKHNLYYLFIAIVDILAIYLSYKIAKEQNSINNVIRRISDGDINASIDPESLHGDNVNTALYVNKLRDAVNEAVEKSLKDEKMKADLITNVSHDLKTPLTSIINYVDLLKKEDISSEKAKEYIDVLDSKSQRLKQMTEDLVEASKISSGNLVINLEKINFNELIDQAEGEFLDRFKEKDLTIVTNKPEQPAFIMADSRSIFRVIENLYVNIYKYALNGTRVYVDLELSDNKVQLSLKNISKEALEVDIADLTERFVRGDKSRSTEGSGLGLSITKNLVLAMNGDFDIAVDGDLFKVIISFDEIA
ncbi:MAG: HAMP domain-containing histidine kinase [Lachnospiraceae bacterium]|nr:HAMP domain-containing histidine kinase [Lachnospiraceae bacterium]